MPRQEDKSRFLSILATKNSLVDIFMTNSILDSDPYLTQDKNCIYFNSATSLWTMDDIKPLNVKFKTRLLTWSKLISNDPIFCCPKLTQIRFFQPVQFSQSDQRLNNFSNNLNRLALRACSSETFLKNANLDAHYELSLLYPIYLQFFAYILGDIDNIPMSIGNKRPCAVNMGKNMCVSDIDFEIAINDLIRLVVEVNTFYNIIYYIYNKIYHFVFQTSVVSFFFYDLLFP